MSFPERCGFMMRAAARSVAVTLERAPRITLPCAGPAAHEAGSRVDARVREYDVEPAVGRDGGVEGVLESRVIGDVHRLTAHGVAPRPETPGLGGDAPRIHVEQRHARAVLGERFGDGEPEAAAGAGDDRPLPGDAEQLCRLHRLLPPATSTTIFMPSWRRSRPIPCSMIPSRGIVSTQPSSG